MRFIFDDVNVYFFHDTITPGTVRGVVYGSHQGAALTPRSGTS
jgi:hypothetical protein